MLCALSIIGQIYFDLGVDDTMYFNHLFLSGFFLNAVFLPDFGAFAHQQVTIPTRRAGIILQPPCQGFTLQPTWRHSV